MNIDEIKSFLLWCLGINYAILMVWFAAFVSARGWMQALHGRWFRLSPETFDAIHYAGMAVYKIGIMLFVLVPLIVLYLVEQP